MTKLSSEIGSVEVNQKVFGVYIRVSTEQQFNHGDSVEMQENLARELIKQENGILYRTYIEGGVSASKTSLRDRKVLMECLNDAKSGLFNNLIVYRRDRLARRTEDSLAIRSTLEEAGCTLHFTASGEMQMMLNDPYGKLMENIRSSLDEIESAQISVRVSDTMYDKAKRGEFSGGNVTYGYENKNGHLVPIESEIPIIKEVENMYLEGYGKHSIIKWLEGEYVKGKGQRHTRATKLKQHKRSSTKWTVETINAILFNKTYSGYLEYKKNNKDGTFKEICVESEYIKPIRSIEMQRKIDSLREKKNNARLPARRYNTTFLLSGILLCSECGQEYTSRTVTKSNGQRYSYYICKGRNGKAIDVCPSKTYKKETLEQFILEGAKQYLEDIANSDFHLTVKERLENRDDQLSTQLEEVDRQLTKSEKDFKTISRLLLDLDMDDDMYDMMKDVYQKQQKEMLLKINNLKQSREKIIHELDTQVDEKININKALEQLSGFNNIFEHAPVHVQKQILENFLSKIEIDKEGNVNYSLTFSIEQNTTNIGFASIGRPVATNDESVMFLGGVGDTTTSKNITIQSDENAFALGFFDWLNNLVNFVSHNFYNFITSHNKKLESPSYFSNSTGLSSHMHKEYRLYKRIPSYERCCNILKAANTNIDHLVQYIRDNGLICNKVILKNILDDSNVIRRTMRRHVSQY